MSLLGPGGRMGGAPRRRGARLVLLAAVGAVALPGCWTVAQGVPHYARSVSPAYGRALAAHTRSAHVYRELVQEVMVAATLQTPDFLEARFDEDGRIHALAPSASTAALTAWQGKHPGVTAVVYLEAAKTSWLDLSPDADTWRVALQVGGSAYDATGVESLDTDDPTLRHLFPYVSDFGHAYLVTFPAGAEDAFASGGTLILAGAPARVRLRFPAAR